MGFVADLLGFGNAAGPHFKLDYSTATGAGITTLTQAQLASSSGVANILYASADGASVVLRSDVDVDPIATNGYPRTEWREMATDGTTDRAFNPTTGDHTIEVLLLPMHLPPIKPTFVLCQLHDAVQDLLEITVQRRSDYDTTGKLEVALKVAVGGSSSSTGIPRFVADFGTRSELGTKWVHAKIRCGAIAPGGAAGWQCWVNGVYVQSWDAGIPAWDGINGTNSYYKTGMYLQTKWTGAAGGNGLETDRNEYGEAAWRFIKVTHNGEAAPVVPVIGSRVTDAVSNIRFGTKVIGKMTAAHAPVANGGDGLGFDLTPGLPSGLASGDMLCVLIRAVRGVTSTGTTYTAGAPFTSMPSSPAITSAGWDSSNRVLSLRNVQTTGAYPGGPQLAAHNVRLMLWARPWVSGDTAAVINYPATNTLSDTMHAVMFACSGAKLSKFIDELLDQTPAGLDVANASSNTNETGITFAATTSTSVVGPTGATPGTPEPGSLAIAVVAHETNATAGGVAVVTGGTDALSWAEGVEGATTTVAPAAGTSDSTESEPVWAVDYAVVPASGYNQVIPAKSATGSTISSDSNKPNTAVTSAGKGWGVLFTIAAAKRRRQGHRPAMAS